MYGLEIAWAHAVSCFYLTNVILGYKDVLSFQVPVNEAFGRQVVHPECNLL